MLPRGRRATRVSLSPTSDRLVDAFIVSFVLVASCSWCVAQELIDIAPEDVTRYYPHVSLGKNSYLFTARKEPVTLLLRTDPESEFEAVVLQVYRGKLVLTNGWNTDCQLRFECEFVRSQPEWRVYEKGGSEPFHKLTEASGWSSPSLTKKADGTKLGWKRDSKIQPVSVKDCVLEPKSLGGRLIYKLTFNTVPSGDFSVEWNAKTTVFVRHPTTTTEEPTTTTEEPTTTTEEPTTTPEEPTTTTEEPTTTPEATDLVVTDAPTSSSPETTTTGSTTTAKRIPKVTSKPAVDTQAPPSHSSPSNVNKSSSDTAPSESPDSAAGGAELGPLVAAVVVMQLFATVFLRA